MVAAVKLDLDSLNLRDALVRLVRSVEHSSIVDLSRKLGVSPETAQEMKARAGTGLAAGDTEVTVRVPRM